MHIFAHDKSYILTILPAEVGSLALKTGATACSETGVLAETMADILTCECLTCKRVDVDVVWMLAVVSCDVSLT